MGTKNDPGKYDCYAKAEDDEPMFVLLARDPIAPILVDLWAEINNLNKELTGKDAQKAVEALDCGEEMRLWKAHRDLKDE